MTTTYIMNEYKWQDLGERGSVYISPNQEHTITITWAAAHVGNDQRPGWLIAYNGINNAGVTSGFDRVYRCGNLDDRDAVKRIAVQLLNAQD